MKFHDMKRRLVALALVGMFLGATAVRAETIFISKLWGASSPQFFQAIQIEDVVNGTTAASDAAKQ